MVLPRPQGSLRSAHSGSAHSDSGLSDRRSISRRMQLRRSLAATRISGARFSTLGQRLLGIHPPSPRILAGRLWSVALFLLILMLLTTGRMVQLQVFQAPGLQKRAQDQQQTALRPFLPRRSIVDRRSLLSQEAELLAVDRPVYTLWAHPTLYHEQTPDTLSQKLAPLLKQDPAKLRQRLDPSVHGKKAIRLERWVREDVADQIKELRLDGLELVSERQRIYPQKDIAAEVVGYVDLEHRGQAGLEYSQQALLERTAQPVVIPQDGYGQPLAAEVPTGLLQSSETVLQLTLDMRLQRACRSALKAQVSAFQAERGTVLVMDPRSGEILCMASEPTYDPNRYFDGYDPSLFRNWTVTDLYEPGSTFKPLNVAIALQAGVITPDTRVYDQGRIQVGQWPVQNFDYRERGAHGWLSVGDVLNMSSNVGMVHLMEKMEPSAYYDALFKLGLGSKNGIDLPFAAVSQLKDRRQFQRVMIERATTAFGQGFSLTPVDLLRFHAVIANGGYRVTPHVMRGLVDKATESLVWQPAAPTPERIFSESVTQAVRNMMLDVVEKGTGKPARIEGYEIGGKTGTAQKARSNGGGYILGVRITSFVGYFPALTPRYVVLAVVDSPKGDDAFGSTVAAPIVRSVIQEIIALEATHEQPSETEQQPASP